MPNMVQKPLTFITPAHIMTQHASHLIVQALPGRYILSFFECLPPLILGNTEREKQHEWDKISSIHATCVARLIVAEADVSSFIQVLQQQQEATKQQALHGFKSFA